MKIITKLFGYIYVIKFLRFLKFHRFLFVFFRMSAIFFSSKNQPFSPSLFESGTLRLPKKKSEILQGLLTDKEQLPTELPQIHAKVVDA